MFSLTATLSMAAGIAACTAIFTLVYALLLRPLNVPRADDLLSIYGVSRSKDALRAISMPDYRDLTRRTDVFEGVGAYFRHPVLYAIDEESERAAAELASGNYHELIGVRAALGRMLRPEDDESGAQRVVVLSDHFWRRRFAAAPDVLGRTLRLNGAFYEIVGVAPASFTGVLLDWYGAPDFWVPLSRYGDISRHLGRLSIADRRDFPWLQVTTRLRRGVRLAAANAVLQRLSAEIAREYPASNQDISFIAMSVSHARVWPGRRGVMIDFAAVLFTVVAILLVIALLNVTNLLLARMTSRTREIAIRIAVGATPLRLARQLMVEACVLAGLATLASVPLSAFFLWAISRMDLPFFIVAGALDLSPDWRLFTVVATLCVACAVVLGTAPALRAWRMDFRSDLIGGLRRRPIMGRTWDARHTLAALQIAVCLTLSLGAGMLGKRLLALISVELGYSTKDVTLFELETYILDYTPEQNAAFYRQLLARVRQVPGVAAAALAANTLPSPIVSAQTISLPDAPNPSGRQGFSSRYNVVSRDYFSTLKMPILVGRAFDARDEAATNSPVAILNETAARRLWSDPSQAIGRYIRVRDDKQRIQTREVIGVVRNAIYAELDEPPRPYLFLPVDRSWTGGLTLHVLGPRDPGRLAVQIRRELRLLDPRFAISEVLTLDEHVATRTAAPSLAARLALAASVSGVILAMIGLYAVLACLVAQRRTELAIRMSIGAAPQRILRFVIGFGMRITAVGAVLGLAGSVVAIRLLSTQLTGVDTNDPVVYILVLTVVVGAALGACVLPAHRASRLDPWGILRR